MDLFLAWLIAPLGMLAIALGLALLIEVASGISLPWGLRPALGMSVAIVVAQFGTAAHATAVVTLPAIIGLGALGIALGFDRLGPRPSLPEVVVPSLVLVLFAAPFIVSGDVSWPGFIKLDDTATWMGLTDHSFEHSRAVGNFPPSTFHAMVDAYLGVSYPIGGFVPAALMHEVSGQDLAFTMAPSMGFGAAAMAAAIYELTRPLLTRRLLGASIAVLASLSSILLGYYLWGGVKELVVVASLPLLAGLGGWAARLDWPSRAWMFLSFAIAAIIAEYGPGGFVWVGAILVGFAIALALDCGLGRLWAVAWPVAVATVVLVVPSIVTPEGVFNPLDASITESVELGNLRGPLNPLHAAGIWPAIDFRDDPHVRPGILVLAVVVLAIAAVTVYACARMRGRKGLPIAAFVGGAALGTGAIIAFGSPWVDGKAMAIVSPALLTGALIGLALVAERTQFRIEAGVLGAVIAGVVLWSALLAYQGAWLAPRAPFDELADIGERFAGDGPLLSNEVAIYGPRHFLRKEDPEGATDLRNRPVLLRGGEESSDDEFVDLDRIETSQFDPYNLIVTRRSPAESRPPASFSLAYSGEYYNVWQRNQVDASLLVEHMPLGDFLDAGGVPNCSRLESLAAQAGPTGEFTAATVERPFTLDFSGATLPAGWTAPTPYTFVPTGSGIASTEAQPGEGQFEIWLGGPVFGGLEIGVDGQEVASVRGLVQNTAALEPLGTVALDGSVHTFTFSHEEGGLHPGSASQSWGIGPVTLVPVSAARDPGLVTVSAARVRDLCGKRWDWVEAYG